MARTKVYGERVRRSFLFEPEVMGALNAEAEKRAVSVTLLVNRAVSEWLARQKDPSFPVTIDPESYVSAGTHVLATPTGSVPTPSPKRRMVEPRLKKNK